MKDICFLSGLVVGAGIGMIVAAKSKQIKKIVECGEQGLMDAANDVKEATLEPICECVNNAAETVNSAAEKVAQKTKTMKKNGKKQNPQNKEK